MRRPFKLNQYLMGIVTSSSTVFNQVDIAVFAERFDKYVESNVFVSGFILDNALGDSTCGDSPCLEIKIICSLG